MSRKTENIYKAIESLEDIQNQISIINQLAKNTQMDELEIEKSRKHLENIEFEMMQQLKSLRFWIDSLYTFNGKSTSRAKQAASKENGKKGGRPPKEITEARKKILYLENELIPQLERSVRMADDLAEEERLKAELEQANSEFETLKNKISEYKFAKN